MKAAVIVLLVLRCSTADIPTATVHDSFMRNVQILVPGLNQTRTCSGVVLKTDLVLTAAHCYGPGILVDQKPATVVKIDIANDLLLLSADTLTFLPLTIGEIPVPSTKVYTVSNPGSYRDQVFIGYVASIEKALVNISIGSAPGASGAGLYNDRGQLIAVTSQIYIVAGLPVFIMGPHAGVIREFVKGAL